MKTFHLKAKANISVYTTVEADTLDEAIEKAKDRNVEPYKPGLPMQTNEVWAGLPMQIKEVWIGTVYYRNGGVFDIEENN